MARRQVPEPPAVATVVEDMVNNPGHYQAHEDGFPECKEAIRAQLGRDGYIAFIRGTIAAYNWRIGRKFNDPEDAAKIGFWVVELESVLREE